MKEGKILVALVAGFAAGTLLGALFSDADSKKLKKKKIKEEILNEELGKT